MVTLFDQERVWEIYDYNVKKEAKEEGINEGRKLGIDEGLKEAAQRMLETGMDRVSVSRILGLNEI